MDWLSWVAGRLQHLGLVKLDESASSRTNRLEIVVFAQPYVLRCEHDESAGGEVRLSVRKRHAIVDRLLGRASFDASDAFVRVLLDVLEREPELQQVTLAWD